MKAMRILALAAAASLVASAGWAQSAGLGTTKVGVQAAIATAIASAVSSHTDIQMRTQTFAGTPQYVATVNAGRLDFGISNSVELRMAIAGELLYEGRPNPNLRLVARLVPFYAGFLVPEGSDIKRLADVKGKRLSGGFDPQPLPRLIHLAYLRNVGLSYDDVTVVPASNWGDHWQQFQQGRIDGASIGVGTGAAREAEARLGKLRYLDLDPSPQAVARMNEAMPGARVERIGPVEGIPGLAQPTYLMALDYTVWAGRHVADETVYAVVKTLYEQRDELKATGPHWREYDPDGLSLDIGVTFHPGAEKLFREKGILKGAS